MMMSVVMLAVGAMFVMSLLLLFLLLVLSLMLLVAFVIVIAVFAVLVVMLVTETEDGPDGPKRQACALQAQRGLGQESGKPEGCFNHQLSNFYKLIVTLNSCISPIATF